jgi:hypothetical protein
MDARQASKLPGCAGGWACAMSGGENEHSRLAKTMVSRTLLHPRAALEEFMRWRLTRDLRYRLPGSALYSLTYAQNCLDGQPEHLT